LSETDSKSGPGKFWTELKRRRVIRVLVIYVVASWLVISAAETLLPNLNLPEWSVTLVIALVVLGFPIVLALAWIFDIGPKGLEVTSQASPATEEPAEKPEAAASPTPLAATTTPNEDPEDRLSIAVLPFVNMSGDPENEYFSDGIAEEILNLLTKLPQLMVASRTSSFKFKGEKIDIPEVAGALGVNTILEGSVRRAGERVRITAQLIEVDTDSHLWSETYDRELKDVFAIQDDIARSIVAALEVTLTPRDRRAIQNVATADVQAYDYYLRGRKYFYEFTRRQFHNANRMFLKAIEQDPNYALAYAGMADVYSLLYQWADSSKENIAKADAASIKAITLDPDLAEAHAARGTALAINERHDEAERAFESAILLNPGLYEPYYFYGRDCLGSGKFEKAARLFSEACKIRPEDYQAPSFLAMAYAELGREKDHAASYKRSLECVEKHVDLHPDDGRALTFGAYALVEQGQPERAREWLDRALDADRDEPAIMYNVACTHCLLGETDKALELLDRAIEQGYGHRAWLSHDPDLAPLRDDPRFQKLLDRLG
jgi:adenylate cyclase